MNSNTRLSAFGADPFTNAGALDALLHAGQTAADYPGGSLEAVIVRFVKNHKPPDGAQASLGFEVQPFKDTILSVTGMHVRGVHLGSFYNVNQPDANTFGNFGRHMKVA